MYKNKLVFIITVLWISIIQLTNAQVKLKYDQNKSLTYAETIEAYQLLDKQFKQARLFDMGPTDIGKPLSLFIISKNEDFDPVSIKKKGKVIVLINNGIHPGEACGIDAGVKLAQNLLYNKEYLNKFLENVVLAIIPAYNIGGMLNRSPYHRANQNGPEEHGFRGNARNLDLNRDFIKTDTRNARTFSKIFNFLKPEVFLDTHTTNGSDHQYSITLIATQHNKLHPIMGNYLNNKMVPALFAKMKESPYELIPYVNSINRTPDKGISGYLDAPMVSTGYASLFNTFAFMTENHVYKPFEERVLSVYHFMLSLLEFTNNNSETISQLKKQADKETCNKEDFVTNWKLDTSKYQELTFKGYLPKQRISQLTGKSTMYYDKNDPFEKQIPYYNEYVATSHIKKPFCYIIPQAWHEAIEKLKLNEIKMSELSKDTILQVQVYYINDFKTSNRSYNGHFVNSGIKTRTEIQNIRFYKGDFIIRPNQPSNNYIIQVLEPDASGSFFSWNFFDSSMENREYFSPSVFEEKAQKLLKENPDLNKKFETKKKEETEFAESHYAQLRFIYMNSPYYEKSYRRYPVARINDPANLPIDSNIR